LKKEKEAFQLRRVVEISLKKIRRKGKRLHKARGNASVRSIQLKKRGRKVSKSWGREEGTIVKLRTTPDVVPFHSRGALSTET